MGVEGKFQLVLERVLQICGYVRVWVLFVRTRVQVLVRGAL